MTHDEHKARHKALHEAFDELVADYLRWNPDKTPSTTTCMDLMIWSHEQTRQPWQEDTTDTAHSISVCGHCGESVTDPASHLCTAELMEHDR
jgi:hypothetical protein